ncbi:MAG: molybdopterin molybdotransferase MoeA [Sphingomonadales bacterium]|nr:molybdopterin molybdotransferase MoeA [Sphingomonadales bacterium]
MINTEQAAELLKSNPLSLKKKVIHLMEGMGMYTAEASTAIVAVPPFDNSAMDGYAFCWTDFHLQKPMKIMGEVPAGETQIKRMEKGTAIRIFTGAMVPEGADTVVMQEKTRVDNGLLWIEYEQLKQGGNVRKAGSQSDCGDVLLQAGQKLTPGAMGLLASAGVSEVCVWEMPAVSVVVTGNEIVSPGKPLLPGQVYECNSYSLLSALYQLGISPNLFYASDTAADLRHRLETALETSDLVLVTGGVSVGDYDLVVPTLSELGADCVFHKLKQKPAKPLYFGTKGEKRIFGLPGNPASVLTCWYAWIRPYMLRAVGVPEQTIYQQAILENDYRQKPGLTHFVKAYLESGKVQVLAGQESYRMDAFARANCFIKTHAETEFLQSGEVVNIILF